MPKVTEQSQNTPKKPSEGSNGLTVLQLIMKMGDKAMDGVKKEVEHEKKNIK